jgi:hypothetical protein
MAAGTAQAGGQKNAASATSPAATCHSSVLGSMAQWAGPGW